MASASLGTSAIAGDLISGVLDDGEGETDSCCNSKNAVAENLVEEIVFPV